MSLSCLHLAKHDVRGTLSVEGYTPPSDEAIGHAREEIVDDSEAFMSWVWKWRKAGMQYVKALWEYTLADNAPSDDDAAGGGGPSAGGEV